MPLNFEQVTSDLLVMGIGGLTTGFVWVIRAVLKLQRDLDAAHYKIRGLYDRGTAEDCDCSRD